jgi:pyruvate dehydrogenase E2 component (dihydrolipoamide acetyltransferase)
MDAVSPLLVPQVNVNDDTVLLVRWTVAQFGRVAAGDVVCEVETSKAAAEVTAHASGVLVQSATPPLRVRIGEDIGAIGPTPEAVSAYWAARRSEPADAADSAIKATTRAAALAGEHGVSIADVARAGVKGTVKEADVRRFVEHAVGQGQPAHRPDRHRPDRHQPDRHQTDEEPRSGSRSALAGLSKYVEPSGPLSAFDLAVAANLRRSTSRLILTSIDAECHLDLAHARIERALGGGLMLSLLHILIEATAHALPRFPRLMSFVHDGTLYQYRAVDIAFVVRSGDGALYTPVIRGADRLDLHAIGRAGQAVTLRVLRGTAKVEDLEGACFTISQVAVGRTVRVAALPSFGQSAVLGVSAERTALELDGGAVVPRSLVTLTLTYDHTVCDGVYAAMFLEAVIKQVEGAA